MNKVNLSKFYTDGDWVIVEEILRDCLDTLSYLPTEDTSPEDFKAQIIANKKLRDGVEKFLSQAKIYTQDKPSLDTWI